MTHANDIITMAAQIKKPNKHQALAILRDMMSTTDNAAGDIQMAELFAFFIPPPAAKAKTPEQWVAKCAGKDDVRFYLNYVHSDGARLVGTNGPRMHWIETDAFQEGFYLPGTLDAIKLNATYPDIALVIPEMHSHERQVVALKDLKAKEIDWTADGTESHEVAYVLPNDTQLLKAYVDSAFNREPEMVMWLPEEKNSGIRLQSLDGVRNAVIMPIRS